MTSFPTRLARCTVAATCVHEDEPRLGMHTTDLRLLGIAHRVTEQAGSELGGENVLVANMNSV